MSRLVLTQQSSPQVCNVCIIRRNCAHQPFAADAKSITDSIKAKSSALVPLERNLVDTVWGNQRPTRTKKKVEVLDMKYAGQYPPDWSFLVEIFVSMKDRASEISLPIFGKSLRI